MRTKVSLTPPRPWLLIALGLAGCATQLSDPDCRVRTDREIDWDDTPGSFDLSPEEAAAEIPSTWSFRAVWAMGDHPGWTEPEQVFDVSFEVDHTASPRFRRTDGGGRNCRGGPYYDDQGRALVIPTIWSFESRERDWRFHGPSNLLVHDVEPLLLGVLLRETDLTGVRVEASPEGFPSAPVDVGPSDTWFVRHEYKPFASQLLGIWTEDGVALGGFNLVDPEPGQ